MKVSSQQITVRQLFNGPSPLANLREAADVAFGTDATPLRVAVTGKGPNLHFNGFYGGAPALAQVRASNGQCWEATYPTPDREATFGWPDDVVDYLAKKSAPAE